MNHKYVKGYRRADYESYKNGELQTFQVDELTDISWKAQLMVSIKCFINEK